MTILNADGVDEETGEQRVRPFADVLRDLGRGAVIDEAAVMLQDIVKAVRERGKKGRLTLTVEVAPMKGDAAALVVSAQATAKPPAGEPTSAVFFADEPGNLLREDPRQLKMTFREIAGRGDKEFKQA